MIFLSETGLNHQGKRSNLIRMVKEAVSAGVDGIIVQVLEREYYDKSKSHKNWIDIEAYRDIYKYLKKKDLIFGISIRNFETLELFKKKKIKLDLVKIIGYKYNDYKLISKATKRYKDKVYLSTAISSFKDIKKIKKKFKSINFIHTSYKKSIENSNLSMITKIRSLSGVKEVAYGLHCDNSDIIKYVIPLQPSSIFFYIKLKKDEIYPDNEHAILLSKLKRKLNEWKKIQTYVGNGEKKREKLSKWIDLGNLKIKRN